MTIAQPYADSNADTPFIRELYRERPTSLLLALSFALSAAYVLFTVLPFDFVLGTGPFWNNPSFMWFDAPPVEPAVASDSSIVIVGYTSFQRSPWGWPLLWAPNIAAPGGTNIFWLDAVPWVSLLGKLIYTVTNQPVNLLGAFLFACLALPGVAMTGVLAAAGQRSLMAMTSATVIGGTVPYLWYRWGPFALLAQCLIVFALALYVAESNGGRDGRHARAWLGLLAITLLTNIYIFVMVGGIWAATWIRRGVSGDATWGRLLGEFVATVGVLIGVMVITGILSPELK